MKVSELIKYLEQCPDEAEVVITDYQFPVDSDGAFHDEDKNIVIIETTTDFFAE